MQHAFSSCNGSTSKSEVLLLPIIDLSPSDESCTYSTLIYIQRQTERLDIPTPCITFDQPLWIRAAEIIKAKLLNIVCRHGGFHTMMSFMGSIGSMMKGSGLEEALETVYGPNAVAHMISGKAISRALRGHFLVEADRRYWAGLWTDLIIEQVMMQSIKSRGGLTRGRRITETVRL